MSGHYGPRGWVPGTPPEKRDPAPAVSPDRERLREEIVEELSRPYSPTEWDVRKGYLDPEEVADVLLSGPLAALLAERDEARAQARLAWDVHAEHVDRMNVLILQAQAERDELARKLAAVEALADEYDRMCSDTWNRHRAAISYDFDLIALRIRRALGEASEA